MRNYNIFVAKTRIYDIFVAKIYDYALIDSFWGSAGFLDSPTSYAILPQVFVSQNNVQTIEGILRAAARPWLKIFHQKKNM